MAENVQITVPKEQAIVLFEFLSRFGDTRGLAIEHQSEERVLWDLQAQLERLLLEPLDPAYPEIVRQAREAVRDPRT